MKEALFSKIKQELERISDLEEIRLSAIRSKKEKNGEKIFTSERFNSKKYEVIKLRGDEVYLRTILCIGSVDAVKIPLYKIRNVNIYQLAYELEIIK